MILISYEKCCNESVKKYKPIILSGFDTFEIESALGTYKLHIVQVPPITEPVTIDTTSRLTPSDEPKSPLINSARIVGSLPNSEFMHYISTTGERPISFSAENLPPSLTFNESTGTIMGKAPGEGRYNIKILARNKYGADMIDLQLVVGDYQRLSPVMGWSSWYTQSHAISEEGILNMSNAARSSGINEYGFVFLNIDDCWQGPRSENRPYNIQGKKPFNKDGVQYGGFNDFKNMTDYLHSLGFKVGIYSGPKPSTYAGFLGSSSFNSSGMDYNNFSPYNGNTNERGPIYDENGTGYGTDGNPGVWQPTQYYGAYFYGYEESHGGKSVGTYWFGAIDVQQFANWGFDFMKWDWLLYNDVTLTKELTKSLSDASKNSGRNMVLSLSNNVGHDRELMKSVREIGASMARISSDISDNWYTVLAAAAEALYFIDLVGNGFYPDPDMLQIGYIGTAGGLTVDYHKTYLTTNEQYYQISFWAIFPAPMILSCDLSQLDDFTLGLLKNREVVLINQDSFGLPSQTLYDNSVILRKLSDGVVAFGVFNDDTAKDITIKLEDVTETTGVAFPRGAVLRSVWEQKDLGIVEDEFTIELDDHQGLLFKLIPII